MIPLLSLLHLETPPVKGQSADTHTSAGEQHSLDEEISRPVLLGLAVVMLGGAALGLIGEDLVGPP